jgi:hypothetical protein
LALHTPLSPATAPLPTSKHCYIYRGFPPSSHPGKHPLGYPLQGSLAYTILLLHTFNIQLLLPSILHSSFTTSIFLSFLTFVLPSSSSLPQHQATSASRLHPQSRQLQNRQLLHPLFTKGPSHRRQRNKQGLHSSHLFKNSTKAEEKQKGYTPDNLELPTTGRAALNKEDTQTRALHTNQGLVIPKRHARRIVKFLGFLISILQASFLGWNTDFWVFPLPPLTLLH